MLSDAENTIGTIFTSFCHPGYARPGFGVSVDKLNPVLERFAIRAIPPVVFFKNGHPVKSLSGLQPASACQNAVRALS